MYIWKTVAVCTILCVRATVCIIRDFSLCHDDFTSDPTDGVLQENSFTWLGFVEYVHETTELPHHNKAPRVVLVHKQFVVGTAMDMLHLPKNYKLGNVIFGDYERDEEDCGLTREQIKIGIRCPRAYIEIPLLDVTPHPEFTRSFLYVIRGATTNRETTTQSPYDKWMIPYEFCCRPSKFLGHTAPPTTSWLRWHTVLLHRVESRFGVGNSLALVKLLRPMKSHYMVPICLPTLDERTRKRKHKFVILIDYVSSVPRDFDSERLAKKTLRLYIHRDCKRHRTRGKLGSEGLTHVLCTSGCGVRPGAPIISHSVDGPYELMGVATGGTPCLHREMRRRLNNEPPLYIDVYPYITWIINVISAHQLPNPYPQNFMLVDAGSSMGLGIHKGYLRNKKKEKGGWSSRTYMRGNFCFKSRKDQRSGSSFFYSEKFEVNAEPPAKISVLMKISAGIECTIVCARILMPNRLTKPDIDGVGGYNITIKFDTDWFPYSFYFSVALDGKNSTAADMKEWVLQRKTSFWSL